MKCPQCNSDIGVDSKFCKECGANITSVEDGQPTFTRTIETPTHDIAPGTVFAERYEILEKLGEGGMGEVYRAIDKNLDRQVAIKVLPAAFAEDEERLARFEREAKLLAVLNHTNIAAIHGLEQSEGQRFLVLELAGGETLKDILDKGPMELEEALNLCRQITEGLEAAHEKGIIHRDLKPGNIIVTPKGEVKILDFGLAKAFTGETTGIDIEKSPTITARMTKPGVVLGTAAYMSPEQARGRAVDKRTDIWAFGCVLFECLTGMRAFGGETVSDTIAQILKTEPDWTELPSITPPTIRLLLRRCLQKDVRNRLHDIADARIEIGEPGELPTEVPAFIRRFPWRWTLVIGAACIMIGAVIGFMAKKSGVKGLSSAPITSAIKVESGHSLDGLRMENNFNWPSRIAMDISADGTFIIYCAVNDDAESDAKPQLFLRKLSQLNAEPILGTEGGIAPFLSPDDQWVGFWVDGKLKRIPIEGGIPQDICKARIPFGASWGDDDTIVFSRGYSGLFYVSSQGGEPDILTVPDSEAGEFSHRLPSHLSNGKGVLFTMMKDAWDVEPRVAILENATMKWRILVENASYAYYIPTGHLVFLRRGALYTIPFDLRRLDVYGQPILIIPDIMHMINLGDSDYNTASGQISISDSGNLVYIPGGMIPDRRAELVWFDQEGNEEPITSNPEPYFSPRFSPDGLKIIYMTLASERHLRMYDIKRNISTPLVSDGNSTWPNWTPDGKKIVFAWMSSGPIRDIYIIPADGSGAMEQLITSPYNKSIGSFSPDGNLMAYVEDGNSKDILIYDFRKKKSTPFAASDSEEAYPEFSPDGRWLAFCTNEEGYFEVYIRPSSGIGETIKVSSGGGRAPLWARSGKQLFYRNGDQIWIVDVKTEPNISLTTPRLLFDGDYRRGEPIRGYDISLDDQRFLMAKAEVRKPRPVTGMILIQNWFDEVKRLVPTKK